MKEITSSTSLQEISSQEGILVIDFWATWCQPCKVMMPILEEVEQKFPEDKVKFVKVNAEENLDLTLKYQISSVPTLVILKDGQFQKKIMGLKNRDFLIKEINNQLAN